MPEQAIHMLEAVLRYWLDSHMATHPVPAMLMCGMFPEHIMHMLDPLYSIDPQVLVHMVIALLVTIPPVQLAQSPLVNPEPAIQVAHMLLLAPDMQVEHIPEAVPELHVLLVSWTKTKARRAMM